MDRFQKEGGSLIIAKGNCSRAVMKACKKYGGFYLGSIGDPAAVLAQDCIHSVKVLEFPELGMEAIWEVDHHEVEDFPAFIVVDDKGNDFFKSGKYNNCMFMVVSKIQNMVFMIVSSGCG